MTTPNPNPRPAALDLEVKDPHIIFESVWKDLEQDMGGADNLSFPREIFWLNGAPGAGKGTQTKLIMKYKDLESDPIVVSSLLTSPEAKKMIAAGKMASDKEVTYLVLKKLLSPEYADGALVDGFPRTQVQADILKLFYEKMKALRIAMHSRPDYELRFPKPHFRIIVLYVDEAESVKRQLYRGQKAKEASLKNPETAPEEVRTTDLDPELVRRRYQTFKEVTYEALRGLRNIFDYHFIDASGSIEDVRLRIEAELAYQSSLELEPITYDRISRIPIAVDVLRHARQELVKRLDFYSRHHSELFGQIISFICDQIMPIVRRHAPSGLAVLPITSKVFTDPLAQAMLVDIFAERGYHAVIYNWSRFVPERVDQVSGKIIGDYEPTFRVEVRFHAYEVRKF